MSVTQHQNKKQWMLVTTFIAWIFFDKTCKTPTDVNTFERNFTHHMFAHLNDTIRGNPRCPEGILFTNSIRHTEKQKRKIQKIWTTSKPCAIASLNSKLNRNLICYNQTRTNKHFQEAKQTNKNLPTYQNNSSKMRFLHNNNNQLIHSSQH